MSRSLQVRIEKQVPSIAKAMKALDVMGDELTEAKTYEQINRVIKQAEALKVLLDDVEGVKARAEDVILRASIRIAEETKKLKAELKKAGKAGGPGRGKRSSKKDI